MVGPSPRRVEHARSQPTVPPVNRGVPLQSHFDKRDLDARLRELPSRFAAGEATALQGLSEREIILFPGGWRTTIDTCRLRDGTRPQFDSGAEAEISAERSLPTVQPTS